MAANASPLEFEVPAIVSEQFVLFPHGEVMLTLGDQRSLAALKEAIAGKHLIAFVPSNSSLHGVTPGTIGTLATIRETRAIQNGAQEVAVKGLWRIRVERFTSTDTWQKVFFGKVDEPGSTQNENSMKMVYQQIDEFVKLIPGIPDEIVRLLRGAETPGELADMCAYSPGLTHEERVDLLNTLDQEERLRKVSRLFERQLDAMRNAVKRNTILECEKCAELADMAFDSGPGEREETIVSFLNHVIKEHSGELIALLAEKYGPVFMRRRALR
jgi:ATP-dependent Lon protease